MNEHAVELAAREDKIKVFVWTDFVCPYCLLGEGSIKAAAEAEAPGSGTSIALGTALDAVPGALVLGVTLRAGGADLALVVALALANVPAVAEWPDAKPGPGSSNPNRQTAD